MISFVDLFWELIREGLLFGAKTSSLSLVILGAIIYLRGQRLAAAERAIRNPYFWAWALSITIEIIIVETLREFYFTRPPILDPMNLEHAPLQLFERGAATCAQWSFDGNGPCPLPKLSNLNAAFVYLALVLVVVVTGALSFGKFPISQEDDEGHLRRNDQSRREIATRIRNQFYAAIVLRNFFYLLCVVVIFLFALEAAPINERLASLLQHHLESSDKYIPVVARIGMYAAIGAVAFGKLIHYFRTSLNGENEGAWL